MEYNRIMTETESDELDVEEAYDILRKDAKLLVTDLTEGVSMWKYNALSLGYLAILGFFLAWLAIYPQVLQIPDVIVALLGALGIGVAGTVGFVITLRKYRTLRRKYTKLFEVASRLK